MLKKNLIILFIIFSILCISSVCFATDNVKNTINNGTNAVVDGVNNLAHDVRNGVGDVENGIEDALTMNNMSDNTSVNTRNTTGANVGDGTMAGTYTTTRTSDVGAATTGLDSTTMWVWIIIAVAAVVIIGLVWYYGSQNQNRVD